MVLGRRRFQITLHGTAGWIAAFGMACLFVFMLTGAPPAEQEMGHWHGPLREVSVNGHGNASWLIGEADGKVIRFKSYHGLDWPGMRALQSGTVVDIWYTADHMPRRGSGNEKSYWIWRLVHDGEELVPYDGVAAIWNRDRTWLARGGVGLLALGAVLWMVARVRAGQGQCTTDSGVHSNVSGQV